MTAATFTPLQSYLPGCVVVWQREGIEVVDCTNSEDADGGAAFAVFSLEGSIAELPTLESAVQLAEKWANEEAAIKPLPEAVKAPVTTEAEARAWIETLYRAGLAFHFDDDPAEMEERGTRQRTFRRDEVQIVRDRLDEVYGFNFCPHGVLIDLIEAAESKATGEGA